MNNFLEEAKQLMGEEMFPEAIPLIEKASQ